MITFFLDDVFKLHDSIFAILLDYFLDLPLFLVLDSFAYLVFVKSHVILRKLFLHQRDLVAYRLDFVHVFVDVRAFFDLLLYVNIILVKFLTGKLSGANLPLLEVLGVQFLLEIRHFTAI